MSPSVKYRDLTDPEIKTLKEGGCRCDNWKTVKVTSGFNSSLFINVTFSGDIKLGECKKTYTDESGVSSNCGISNAHIHNCRVGTNVLISNIGDYIANYNIEDDVVIKNCGRSIPREILPSATGQRLRSSMRPAAGQSGSGTGFRLIRLI